MQGRKAIFSLNLVLFPLWLILKMTEWLVSRCLHLNYLNSYVFFKRELTQRFN